MFGCDGTRKELYFSLLFLDSCVFSLTGDCSKLSAGELMLNPSSFTPSASWCRLLQSIVISIFVEPFPNYSFSVFAFFMGLYFSYLD